MKEIDYTAPSALEPQSTPVRLPTGGARGDAANTLGILALRHGP